MMRWHVILVHSVSGALFIDQRFRMDDGFTFPGAGARSSCMGIDVHHCRADPSFEFMIHSCTIPFRKHGPDLLVRLLRSQTPSFSCSISDVFIVLSISSGSGGACQPKSWRSMLL